MFVALRVAATILVVVLTAERSFFRLKVSKIYLRSIMTQDSLNGLAIKSINREESR